MRGKANPSTALFVDDNSMIKNYAQGKVVSSKKIQYYDGKKISEGFWACHIWDRLEDETLTNTDNSLFSFIPNIVWLPKELSRLTDHVPIVKDVLKQLSVHIYGQLRMPNQALQSIVDESWEKLSNSRYNQVIPKSALPAIDDFNTMIIPDRTISRKVRKLKKYTKGLLEHGHGRIVPPDSQVHKYGRTIVDTDMSSALTLGQWLEGYLNALQ